MEPACEFGLEYRPIRQGADPVVEMHVQNCRDCQQQVALV